MIGSLVALLIAAHGSPIPMSSQNTTIPLTVRAAAGDVIIAGKPAMVFNGGGDHVLIIFHGLAPASSAAEDYYALAQQYASDGWCVIVVRGNELPGPVAISYPYEIANAAHWGTRAATDVVNTFAHGRRVAVLGHSMGGAAAIHAAQTVNGLVAHVAMHAANIDPDGFSWVRGPTLFTTGTADDGTFLGFTSPSWSKSWYQDTWSKPPKALVNVKGNNHIAPSIAPAFGNMEYLAAKNWLNCYGRQDAQACRWLATSMCTDPSLEWCQTEGVGSASSSSTIYAASTV